jgi:hypothetical protein
MPSGMLLQLGSTVRAMDRQPRDNRATADESQTVFGVKSLEKMLSQAKGLR